jgi:hypothetical protein
VGEVAGHLEVYHMPELNAFTPQQKAALEKAWDLLTEHFDGCALSVLAECGENQPQEAVRSYWHGGRMQALGMVEDFRHQLLTKEADATEP